MKRFFLAITLGGFLCMGCEGYGDVGLSTDAAYSNDESTQFGSISSAIKEFPPTTLKCGEQEYVKFDWRDPLEGEGKAKKRSDASKACYQSLRDLATDATTCDDTECADDKTCHPGSQWTTNRMGRCTKGKDKNGNKQWTCKCKVTTMSVWCTRCRKPKMVVDDPIDSIDSGEIDSADYESEELEGAVGACEFDQ